MAKPRATRRSASRTTSPSTTTTPTKRPRKAEQDPLVAAATTIGTTLGHLAGRMETLDKQRAQLIAEVQRVVAHGQELLKRLGHTESSAEEGSTEETAPHEPPAPPAVTATSHREKPTARHDASVMAKAQHAAERLRPRATFRSQNR